MQTAYGMSVVMQVITVQLQFICGNITKYGSILLCVGMAWKLNGYHITSAQITHLKILF